LAAPISNISISVPSAGINKLLPGARAICENSGRNSRKADSHSPIAAAAASAPASSTRPTQFTIAL
jgi:hypothetical protein